MSHPVISSAKHLQRYEATTTIFISVCKRYALGSFICLLGLSGFTFPATAFARDEPLIEEIIVYVNVQGLGGTEMDVAIKGKEAYLSVTELFDYLKIKNKVSTNQDSICGFFITQNNTYLISKTTNSILLQQKLYN